MNSTYSISLIEKLLVGKTEIIICGKDNKMSEHSTINNCLILSGAFNPLHIGHTKLASAAGKLFNKKVLFDLSVMNADKGLLNVSDICVLMNQFNYKQEVILTRKPLFLEKSSCFPNTIFILGYDTAIRVLNKKYYGNSDSNLINFLVKFKSFGCKFLVAGRLWKGKYLTINDLSIPTEYKNLFIELPEDLFRIDTSSSFIRKTKQNKS